jgi:hypothetical protein
LNARAKAPSTIPSSLCSKRCRTPTGYPLSLSCVLASDRIGDLALLADVLP